MASVGASYAILSGRLSGDLNKAHRFLNSMSPEERDARNQSESRLRSKAKKALPLGRKPR